MATKWPKNRRLIGTRITRLDGPDKATGKAKYSFDINRPGMLHAMIVRCPHGHAKVKSVDTAAARKMPGIKAVVPVGVNLNCTVVSVQGDTLNVEFGPKEKPIKRSITITANDVVIKNVKPVKLTDLQKDDVITVIVEQDVVGRECYFAGDELLAIAADTEEHCMDAVRAVKIGYDVLPCQVHEEDVLKKDLQTMQPVPDGKGGLTHNNLRPGVQQETGNVAQAMQQADVTITGTYGVPTICHQCLESHGLVAEWSDDLSSLTVWASTQATVGTAQQLAGHFKIPAPKVNCITHYMGGGYGSKFGPDVQGITCAELARLAGKGVKLMLDRAEEVTVGGNRPSAFGTVKMGAKKDGTIIAYEVDCYGTPGAATGRTVGPLPYVYAFANSKSKHDVIRTNAGQQRAMRAPGHPQSCFLTDCALDDIAAKLGLDPLEVRLKNIPQDDADAKQSDPLSIKAIQGTLYRKQLEIAATRSKWKDKWHPPGAGKGTVKHGIGMALHTWGGQASPQRNECTVIISADGSVLAQTSSQDLGTAQRTLNAIVTAEILGLQPGDITTKIGESAFGPSSGSGGSTTAPSQAPATLEAVTAALDDFFTKLAPKLKAKKEDLAIEPGKVVDTANKKAWAWKEACARLGMESARGTGFWTFAESQKPENAGISKTGVGGVQVAEVLVDIETGVVRCTRFVAVQDCGLIVNLLGCESQVAGGVIMGLNYALFEERFMDRASGRQLNPDMEFYKLGGMKDMPDIIVHMMDMPERGVIGIGEPPTISTHAAIGNAIFNAIGVRVPHTPFTPDRVLAALAKKGGN